jgi:hypothetical protein
VNCQDALNKFSSYYEKELDSREKSIFEKHLNDCSQCKEEWGWFQKTMGGLEQVEMVSPPQDLLSGAIEKAYPQSFLTRFVNWLDDNLINEMFQPSAVAALAVILLAVVLVNYNKMLPSENVIDEQVNIQISSQDDAPGENTPAVTEHHDSVNKLKFADNWFVLSEKYDPVFRTDKQSTAISYNSQASYKGQNNFSSPRNPLYNYSPHDDSLKPDMKIIVYPESIKKSKQLVNNLSNSPTWQSITYSDKNLLLIIPPASFGELKNKFSSHKAHFAPDLSRFEPAKKQRKLLVVRVVLK